MAKMFSFLKLAALVLAIVFAPLSQQFARAQGASDETAKSEKSTSSKSGQDTVSLDSLFDQLKSEKNPKRAKHIAQKIWRLWSQSGSDTIDLLMGWAAIAIKEKNWATAFDLLDQVVVLAPQYAEGWNRRATLYFLRGQYGRSIHDIEQVLKLETRHFGAMAGMGSILRKLNKSTQNDKRALAIWNKLLEIYPTNEGALKSVAALKEKLSGREI